MPPLILISFAHTLFSFMYKIIPFIHNVNTDKMRTQVPDRGLATLLEEAKSGTDSDRPVSSCCFDDSD